jgi:hypothetical protein
MKFFGRRYSSPAYAEAEQVDVPLGVRCARCDEAIASGDDGWLTPAPFHRACFLRGIVGSVAHQQRRCLCFVPGSTVDDDPALTRRQAAEAAERYFERRIPKTEQCGYCGFEYKSGQVEFHVCA